MKLPKINYPLTLKTKIYLGFTIIALISTLYLILISLNAPQINNGPTPTPQPISPIHNPFVTKLTASNISFTTSFVFPQTPASLPVYSAQVKSTDYTNLAARLATNFKLTAADSVGRFFQSSDKTESLYYSSNPLLITYSIVGNLRPNVYTGKSNPTPTSAISAVKKFLSSIPEFSSFQIDAANIRFLSADANHLESSTSSKYDLILLSASPVINDYPIRMSGITSSYLQIYIGQNNQIIKVAIVPQDIIDAVEKSQVQISDAKTIQQLVTNGQAQIIHTSYADASYLSPTSLPPVTISRAVLEYRFEDTTKLLVPYFTFFGTFTPENSLPVEIVFTLPASSK